MRDRHTRDGTRRRSYGAPYVAVRSPGNTGRDQYNRPRSDENVAARELEAQSAYNNAAAAAANSNVTAYIVALKEAADAAAAARSGANSSRTSADMEDAASAENWASLIINFSTFGCNVAECRTRGGTASLCGHSEFAYATGGVSTPPKKYLTKTASGTMFDCARTTIGCSGGPASGAKYEYSGSCSYNSANCVTTNTLTYKEYNDAGVCPASTLTINAAQGCDWGDATNPNSASCLMDVAVSKTRVDRSGTGVCCSVGGGTYTIRTGSMYWELTAEDTDADAIARLQASSSWSNWTSANSTSCLSKYESRSNFSFAWQEAQFRATVNIAENVTGVIKVGVYRRAYGSGGAFSQISTEYFSVTGNVAGADEISMDVPNAIGYETYVACLAAGS